MHMPLRFDWQHNANEGALSRTRVSKRVRVLCNEDGSKIICVRAIFSFMVRRGTVYGLEEPDLDEEDEEENDEQDAAAPQNNEDAPS